MFAYFITFKTCLSGSPISPRSRGILVLGDEHECNCVIVAPDRATALKHWEHNFGYGSRTQIVAVHCIDTETEGSTYY